MSCKNKKKNFNATFTNHESIIGGPLGGYTAELAVFHFNIQKNVLKAEKFEVIESYTKLGADIIFIYEPGVEMSVGFPSEKFPNYNLTTISNKYLIVLTKSSMKLHIEEIKTTEATIMARVTGRQFTALGTYNRRSKDRVGSNKLDIYKTEERYVNLKIEENSATDAL